MKRILLAVMFGIGALGFAQNKKKIVKTQIVDKIRDYNPTDLVPYSKDGKKWALMDVKSRKILTDFILYWPSTFNPEFNFSMEAEKRIISMKLASDYAILESKLKILPGPEIKRTIKTNTLGFQMDEHGEIISHHADYEYISRPILYKGEYYTIITKKDKTNILINQKGEEKKGFHFKEISNIGYKDKESGEDVFYVEDFDGKKGFVTISGKKKLYGELLYGLYSRVLGYSLQKDSHHLSEIKKSGVVDIPTQEWVIKLQEKYKIYEIVYTSLEEIGILTAEDRNKATVYFLATDQSGQHFVLDVKGNPILPKN